MGLSADDWSAIGTGTAAVVAIGAAVLAWWQAKIASDARKATAEQATVAREALELQRAERHQADAPTFLVEIVAPAPTG